MQLKNIDRVKQRGQKVKDLFDNAIVNVEKNDVPSRDSVKYRVLPDEGRNRLRFDIWQIYSTEIGSKHFWKVKAIIDKEKEIIRTAESLKNTYEQALSSVKNYINIISQDLEKLCENKSVRSKIKTLNNEDVWKSLIEAVDGEKDCINIEDLKGKFVSYKARYASQTYGSITQDANLNKSVIKYFKPFKDEEQDVE